MNVQLPLLRGAALVGIVLTVLTGCQTAKVDWQSRVGTYSYDQAVIELGPPDKSSKLTDGTLIAEWIESRSSGGITFGIGTGYSSRHTAVGVGQTIGSSSSARLLRLTFAPDGQLTGFSRYRR
jgi:hypothetical protein